MQEKKTEKEKNDKGKKFLCQQDPWADNGNTIWLASTLSLERNLEKFKFPSKLPSDRQQQIISLISKELQASGLLQNPTLFKAESLSPVEKEFLHEHFLTSQSFQHAHSGEAFLTDTSGEFLTTLNIRDHIHLQITDCREELENTWNRLLKIETCLGKTVNFSFSPRFGFLTADPAQCGTGLAVSAFLQLPALIHTNALDKALASHHDDAIFTTGLHGDPKEIIGDLLTIRNNYTLGITEENIISSIRTFATKLLVDEKSARSAIRQEDKADIKDKVSRAFGLLIHSYQIEAIEALNAISLLKLGLDLNWLSGIKRQDFNRLFFQCRRAHLLCEYGEKISQEEIPHKRAEFIHQTLKNAQLKI